MVFGIFFLQCMMMGSLEEGIFVFPFILSGLHHAQTFHSFLTMFTELLSFVHLYIYRS
ncbi:hypothetical protein BDV33DRAFT_176271 [Aspergillus novoparasiticus]|uniref:Uncharacterized protein n=1 Tax=Aspergillus novoparasiticus TaxID=986946 RepID=A0A5N6EKG7_9EURO|nr:hypothetical protein BDV33DRAFT_176271 [Aspergillus novoparasiticus]